MRAAFLRAGFHDCAPVTSSKADSGCNGSLRLELGHRANSRLITAMREIEGFKRSVSPCVSYADSIMLAYTASVNAMGDFGFTWDTLVDPASPRADSDTPDFSDSEGSLDLLSGGTSDFADLFWYYRARGMTAYHLVASLMVGHSVGGFGRPGSILQFLPSTNAAPSLYGTNLLYQSRFNTSDLNGFHTLPSDKALMSRFGGQYILSLLTTGRLYGKSDHFIRRMASIAARSSGTVAPWPLNAQRNTKRLFLEFSVKMSKLRGDSMVPI